MNKKIAIIGLGGVGGYFGFKINQQNKKNDKIEVTFIARNKTYEIIKKNGLTLLSAEHTNFVTQPNFLIKNIGKIIKPDLIIICVKDYDLENICLQLKEKVTKNTVILPLMNGVDIYEKIRTIIKTGIVLPACVYVASHIKETGIVEHKGNTGKIFLGKDTLNYDTNIDWVINILLESGADISYKDSIFQEIWTKFIFIASFGLVSARYNKSIGQVCENELLKSKTILIMKEIKGIADKKQIELPTNIIEKTFENALHFPFYTPTSLQLDINSNKTNNELELFAGAIINYGKQLETNTSYTYQIYTEIKNMLKN